MLPSDMRELREATRRKCEERGEVTVRAMISAGNYRSPKLIWAQEWLAEKDAEAGQAAAHAREQQTIAQKEIDRGIARGANRISLWLGIAGNIIALAALAVAIYAVYHP